MTDVCSVSGVSDDCRSSGYGGGARSTCGDSCSSPHRVSGVIVLVVLVMTVEVQAVAVALVALVVMAVVVQAVRVVLCSVSGLSDDC
jgi:hypothetical protein